MFWNFFDENKVVGYTDTVGVTHYSDGRSSYEDGLGATRFSDGSVAYDTLRGDREHYNPDGYDKSSYTDDFGITRYY